jgi:hypothetical protein
LRDALKNASKLIDKVYETITNMSTRVTEIESEFVETEVQVDDRSKEIENLINEMTIEVNQETNIIAEQTCRADFSNKASACCPDCKKAKFRVPPKTECEKAGCEHSCAYVNATCDKSNQKLPNSCMFPFKYLGKEKKSCITVSPFGEVARPWCYLDTEDNTARAADGKEPMDIGFCDCTELRCFCPKGQRLAPDGKKCVDVTLVQIHSQEHTPRRGEAILNPELKDSRAAAPRSE